MTSSIFDRERKQDSWRRTTPYSRHNDPVLRHLDDSGTLFDCPIQVEWKRPLLQCFRSLLLLSHSHLASNSFRAYDRDRGNRHITVEGERASEIRRHTWKEFSQECGLLAARSDDDAVC
jgi:hypothetical protein